MFTFLNKCDQNRFYGKSVLRKIHIALKPSKMYFFAVRKLFLGVLTILLHIRHAQWTRGVPKCHFQVRKIYVTYWSKTVGNPLFCCPQAVPCWNNCSAQHSTCTVTMRCVKTAFSDLAPRSPTALGLNPYSVQSLHNWQPKISFCPFGVSCFFTNVNVAPVRYNGCIFTFWIVPLGQLLPWVSDMG